MSSRCCSGCGRIRDSELLRSSPLPLWEWVASIVRCEPGEGFLQCGGSPSPAPPFLGAPLPQAERGRKTSPRPAAFNDLGRALGEQFESDRTAEFAGAIGGPGARGLDEKAAPFINHRCGQQTLRAAGG